MSHGDSLSVVIPTVDEADRLPDLLADLRPLGASIVIADGGSSDDTRSVAAAGGAHVVRATRGRARQLRAGADASREPWIMFLHADSRISHDALEAVKTFLSRARDDEYAHFRFALDGPRLSDRFLEFGQRLRERLTGLAYGDQGLIVSRALYEEVDGFPDWPILEDVGILERLGRNGHRRTLSAELVTSSRRYAAEGRFRAWLRNAVIIGAYRLGASPKSLAERFPRTRAAGAAGAARRTIIVFAKAPRPGYVKTRLAADVGADAATRVYRTLGEATVRSLRDVPARLVVYVDPPGPVAEAEVVQWLGTEDIEYRPQQGLDLGERMMHAFSESFDGSDEVCIVGTDIPGLGAAQVTEAFGLLSDNDAVIGPATDGGYYLLALRRPMPPLFAGVPWSTDAVLSATLERAGAIGARISLLAPMTDVDRAIDLPPELMSV